MVWLFASDRTLLLEFVYNRLTHYWCFVKTTHWLDWSNFMLFCTLGIMMDYFKDIKLKWLYMAMDHLGYINFSAQYMIQNLSRKYFNDFFITLSWQRSLYQDFKGFSDTLTCSWLIAAWSSETAKEKTQIQAAVRNHCPGVQNAHIYCSWAIILHLLIFYFTQRRQICILFILLMFPSFFPGV